MNPNTDFSTKSQTRIRITFGAEDSKSFLRNSASRLWKSLRLAQFALGFDCLEMSNPPASRAHEALNLRIRFLSSEAIFDSYANSLNFSSTAAPTSLQRAAFSSPTRS